MAARPSLSLVVTEIRAAARTVVQARAFAVAVILTVALAVGTNASLFAAVNMIWLRSLPYAAPNQLVVVSVQDKDLPGQKGFASYPMFEAFGRAAGIERLAAFFVSDLTVTRIGDPELVPAARVTSAFFPILNAQPVCGRTLVDTDGDAVVLSHRFWMDRFGGECGVVSRALRLDGRPYTIVGVMPPNFTFPGERIKVWLLFTPSPAIKAAPMAFWASIVGRLRPGVTIAAARSELDNIRVQLIRGAGLEALQDKRIAVTSLREDAYGDASGAVLMLFGAVSLMLLIACVNLAALFSARAAERERELAVKTALGASRARLAVQGFTETALMALLGGIGGLIVAVGSLRGLVAIAPADIPHPERIVWDPHVLLYACALTALTAVAFGLRSALRAGRPDRLQMLGSGANRVAGAPHAGRRRVVLVAAQYTLALVLLSCFGLVARTLWKLSEVNRGFRDDHVVSAEIRLAPIPRRGPEARADAIGTMLDRIQAVPGVTATAATLLVLQNEYANALPVVVDGHPPRPGDAITATMDPVSDRYFDLLGVPLLQGRAFDAHDRIGSEPVALVNETMAKHDWPDGDAVGRRFRFGSASASAPWLTVVGVVGDMRRRGRDAAPDPNVFVPLAQQPPFGCTILVRTARDPMLAVPEISRAVWSAEPNAAVSNVQTLSHLAGMDASVRRFQGVLLGSFALLALIQVVLGIYGVHRRAVALRAHEFGVRLALGATARQNVALVLGEAATVIGVGTLAGLGCALAVSQWLSASLFGVTSHDAVALASASAMLAATVLFGSWRAARHVNAVDPALSLRAQ